MQNNMCLNDFVRFKSIHCTRAASKAAKQIRGEGDEYPTIRKALKAESISATTSDDVKMSDVEEEEKEEEEVEEVAGLPDEEVGDDDVFNDDDDDDVEIVVKKEDVGDDLPDLVSDSEEEVVEIKPKKRKRAPLIKKVAGKKGRPSRANKK